MKRIMIICCLLISCGAQPAFAGKPLIPPHISSCVCNKEACQIPPCYHKPPPGKKVTAIFLRSKK